MNYPVNSNDFGDTCTTGEEKLPTQTLADIMHETSALADDVLSMAHRINGFLFVENTENAERPQDPRCLRDELLKTRYDLHTTYKVLCEMTSLLGL